MSHLLLQGSFAKEPYKRDDFLQKRPVILQMRRESQRGQIAGSLSNVEENMNENQNVSLAFHELG